MTSRIPFDDHQLEMEEVEGLLSSPSPSPSEKAISKSSNGESKSGNRWAWVMLLLGVILGFLFTSDTESLRFWEGTGGENVDDIEVKLIEPTATSAPSIFAPSQAPQSEPASSDTAPPDETLSTSTTQASDTISDQKADQKAVDIDSISVNPTPPTPTDDGTPPQTITTNEPNNDTAKSGGTVDIQQNEEKDIDIQTADIDWGAAHYPKPSLVVRPDPPLTPKKAEELAMRWGKWEFVDPKADQRPTDDYCAEYPNRDIPRDKFPNNAWQTDTEYLKEWFDQSNKLVDRSIKAILAEYGKETSGSPTDDDINDIFEFLTFDPGYYPKSHNLIPEAFWTTEKSFQGLVRRVLHAIMTNDSFTFIMGGHSAAAGHGNHFRQSYTMQFHKVMEPVMSLLGVHLTSRNLAQGGMGTLHNALGAVDIYGDSIDIMMWDSGMTEAHDATALDLYWRQSIISGNKVPFLIGAGSGGELVYFNTEVDADIGNVGDAFSKLPECKDEVQCETLPFAARYIKCSSESMSLCSANKFRANCWVDRPDVTPEEPQDEKPPSQVKWHPGFRVHQLTGRVLAIMLLKAIRKALTQWQEADDYALPDDAWHMTAYYDNIRQKISTKVGETACFQTKDFPTRMCMLPIHARTEFTPRANPDKTSISSIVKPNENGQVPHVEKGLLYTGPDVYNPVTAVPEGDIDVLSIISNGRTFGDDRRRHLDEITPGLGWMIHGEPGGYCDGTYNAECARRGSCLILGHQDGRGGLVFNSYSGWLVMTLPAVREGIIVLKIETWHRADTVTITDGWKSIDNKGRRKLRGSHASSNYTVPYRLSYYHEQEEVDRRRQLKKPPPPEICDEFTFDFAVDGKITTWRKDDWEAKLKTPQRVVELLTLLDDPNFTVESKNVELAIRITGCGESTKKVLALTHVYFA